MVVLDEHIDVMTRTKRAMTQSTNEDDETKLLLWLVVKVRISYVRSASGFFFFFFFSLV